MALPAGVGLALILGLALLRWARRGDDEWIVFAVTIALAPLIVMTLLRPEVVAVRYFLIGIAFALLLVASLLADAFSSGTAGKIAAGVFLALFVLGNAVHTARFLEHGRGGYRAALAFMAERSRDGVISVESDHAFRTGLVLQHYARELAPSKHLVVAQRDATRPTLAQRMPAHGPEWRVIQRAENPDATPGHLRDRSGRHYSFAAAFPHAAISGFHWSLYHRVRSPSDAARRHNTTPNP
jgi:hypothetical protein